MEILHQMFITAIAAFAFLILIAKIASSLTNGTAHLSNAPDQQFKSSKSSSKIKSKKKVRFAVDHEEFVINKAVAAPLEAKSIVSSEINGEFVSGCVDDEVKEGESVLVEENVVGECEESDQVCMKLLCDDGIDEAEKEKEGLISEEDDSSDDDWEGVERSDLEKVFAMAAEYCKVDDKLQSLESDVQMQLYALHKVATEGPCHEGQPMALKVSARAKWNSWQKLGNMSPDVAMEQYIALLSNLVPGWSQEIHSIDKH